MRNGTDIVDALVKFTNSLKKSGSTVVSLFSSKNVVGFNFKCISACLDCTHRHIIPLFCWFLTV